eukprot:1666021-Pyramimonas_sp.AAC.1
MAHRAKSGVALGRAKEEPPGGHDTRPFAARLGGCLMRFASCGASSPSLAGSHIGGMSQAAR